jgi:hypothetical protein
VEECGSCPVLCKFYPGICLTTKKKARKNLSQVTKNLSQSTIYILPKYPHITKTTQTHTLQNPHIHPHITKQYKPTTVQIKTNTVQDIPKWNSHNIIKCPQYKVTVMGSGDLITVHIYPIEPGITILWREIKFEYKPRNLCSFRAFMAWSSQVRYRE